MRGNKHGGKNQTTTKTLQNVGSGMKREQGRDGGCIAVFKREARGRLIEKVTPDKELKLDLWISRSLSSVEGRISAKILGSGTAGGSNIPGNGLAEAALRTHVPRSSS